MIEPINVFMFVISMLVGYVAHNYMKNKRFRELANAFESDPTLPLLGNAHQFPADTVGIYKKLEEIWLNHGCTAHRLVLGLDVFIMLSDPEDIEIVLCSNKEIEKPGDYDFFRPWLGDGLLLAAGNKWRRQRKIITPTFHFKILEQFVSVFNRKGDIFVQKLSENKGKVFDIYPFVTLYTLDIICETAMGTNINCQIKSDSEYVKAVIRINQLFTYRSFSMLKRITPIYKLTSNYREERQLLKILHDTTDRVIKSRRLAIEEQIKNDNVTDAEANEDAFSGRKKIAFLDLMLLSKTPEGESLSDEVIREEVDTFMFGGHDTISSALSFVLYVLANNTVHQNLAFEEQFQLFGNDLERKATYSDLQEMKYLERVIKETLRVFPAVPLYSRKLIDDLKLSDGRIIPKGAFITIQHSLMYKNAKYYPDPLKFDPDRFLPENLRKKHPFVYVPFSAGPRNCIGQKFAMLELKSTLSNVLRKFELFSAGEDFKPILSFEVMLKSENGIFLGIRDRKY